MKLHTATGVLVLWSGALTASAQQVEYARATLANEGSSDGQGIAVGPYFYSGWRFQVTGGPVRTTEIGGHFSGGNGSRFFGALVRLDGPNGNPQHFDLTGTDVLGTTTLTQPSVFRSHEESGPLNVVLDNGWYLVLFGSGAFGTPQTNAGLMGQDGASAIAGAQNIVTYRQRSHPEGEGGPFFQGVVSRVFVHAVPATCDADFNADGAADVFDYLDFVDAFASGGMAADFNRDSVVDFFDYLDFVAAFASGC